MEVPPDLWRLVEKWLNICSGVASSGNDGINDKHFGSSPRQKSKNGATTLKEGIEEKQ